MLLEHTPLLKPRRRDGRRPVPHRHPVRPPGRPGVGGLHGRAPLPSSFTGSADHLVSKALYFDDPEGNGLELYCDRPREQWGWENGHVAMATDPLDPHGFLREHLPDPDALDGAAAVGHVHLQVGDITTAQQFYVDTLGFEVTAVFGTQALFVSAGGYHHHLALNTWQSRGAQARWAALGLGEVTIELPDRRRARPLAPA